MYNQKGNINDFDTISLSVASPEYVISLSHGEVSKPETINYRTQKPEKGGLFCERIFGPKKNYECSCGKYKRIRYKGVVCERCGVEVTNSRVRRERMGHIKLSTPIAHIWFLRTPPSRIGLLLDLSVKDMQKVVYFASYIVTFVDEELKTKELQEIEQEYKKAKKLIQSEFAKAEKGLQSSLNKKELKLALKQLESNFASKLDELDKAFEDNSNNLRDLSLRKIISEREFREYSLKFPHIFKAKMGAEALYELLKNIDLDSYIENLRIEIQNTSGQKQKKLIKRLRLAISLKNTNTKPEWFILTVLPVLPPDLRPMVQLDGGRFATSDLNDLYRRVINRNNRLRKLLEIGAPEVIIRNEKRMLQEAVDTLFSSDTPSSSRSLIMAGTAGKKLKSLSDMLKGKQGRFRQNLLGKRVDYSGRSVIVIGPELEMHQCGLPKEMALKLFKPFVIGKLIKKGLAFNVKNAEKVIQMSKKEVWDILEDITKNYYVLLNRAPTLHRLGIQAFQPILIDGKAIQLHPLVCSAFNADFDGDQMAVHLPLSETAQKEAKEIIKSSNNLLKPSSGKPIVTPSQDIVLGIYFLTLDKKDQEKPAGYFYSVDEVYSAYSLRDFDLHDKIILRYNEKLVETTIGRVIFNNECIPEQFRFLDFTNKIIKSKDISNIISLAIGEIEHDEIVKMLDKIKHLGFKYATKSGISICMDDIVIPKEKEEIIENSNNISKNYANKWYKGYLTENEKKRNIISIWAEAKKEIEKSVQKCHSADNHLVYMVDSGARGNWGQMTQLSGMKGLVANPSGEIIELPIKSNFKEGFSISEYFIDTHSGRKGKADTALKTSQSGYLTRKLVDSAQNLIIREEDCGTEQYLLISRKALESKDESFEEYIKGRNIAEDIIDKKTGEVLVEKNAFINDKILQIIQDQKINDIRVFDVLTCESEDGVCIKCYGLDLSNDKKVEIGAPIGIIAAQSIGEPGTQLTMRTFHSGGVATEIGDITQGLTRVQELFEARNPKTPAIQTEITGKVKVVHTDEGTQVIIFPDKPREITHDIYSGYKVVVKKGDKISNKSIIARSVIDKNVIKSSLEGVVVDIKSNKVIIKEENMQEITYKIPNHRMLKVEDGQIVEKGDALTDGHLNLGVLLNTKGVDATQKYIIDEVKSIYSSQGQNVNYKHLEVIVRQMFSKVRIIDIGDSDFLPGSIVSFAQYNIINKNLNKENKRPAYGERLLLGLTKISLNSNSWLSAASFQETIRVLTDAAVNMRMDSLSGLKENVIIGKPIPAGEIYKDKYYKNLKI